jgi:hypothetical protein
MHNWIKKRIHLISCCCCNNVWHSVFIMVCISAFVHISFAFTLQSKTAFQPLRYVSIRISVCVHVHYEHSITTTECRDQHFTHYVTCYNILLIVVPLTIPSKGNSLALFGTSDDTINNITAIVRRVVRPSVT